MFFNFSGWYQIVFPKDWNSSSFYQQGVAYSMAHLTDPGADPLFSCGCETHKRHAETGEIGVESCSHQSTLKTSPKSLTVLLFAQGSQS